MGTLQSLLTTRSHPVPPSPQPPQPPPTPPPSPATIFTADPPPATLRPTPSAPSFGGLLSNTKTLNPIIVEHLRTHLKSNNEVTDELFENIESWIKILGTKTQCANCKKRLPSMDWQCCDDCPLPVCDKCDICARCRRRRHGTRTPPI